MARFTAFVRRHRRALLSVVGAVIAYGLLGFVVAPPIVRRQLESRLGAALHRPVAVRELHVNPFALSITIRGFVVQDPDGATFAAFDELYVNANLLTLVRKEVDLSDIRLVRPFARVALDEKGQLNFQDLLQGGGDGGAVAKDGGGLSLRVERLRIAEARVEFSDRSRRRPFRSTLGPITIELQNFRTRRPDNQSPYEFSGQTESGERFAWSGDFLLDPIRSKGTLGLENVQIPKYAPYTQDAIAADISSGVLSVKAGYEVEWGPRKHVLRLADGSLSVRRLEAGTGTGAPLLALDEIDVGGVSVDVLERTADVGRVSLRGGRVAVERRKDGRVTLMELLAPPASPTRVAVAAPESPPPPVRFRVGEVALESIRIDVSDPAAPRPVELALGVERLELAGLTSDPASPASLGLSMAVGGQGKLAVRGSLYPVAKRGEVDVDLDAIALAPFGPYLDPAVDVGLEAGALSARLHVRFDAGKPGISWGARGGVRVDGLRVVDGRRREELLGWKSLRIEGIDALPGRAAVREIRLSEPRLRLAVWEDHERNLSVVLRRARPAPGEGREGRGGSPVGEARPDRAPALPPGGPPFRWSVASLQVTRGRLAFVDRSVKPAALLEATDVTVGVRGLSSDPTSRAQVEVTLGLGEAPFSVRGALQPQLAGDATDLSIQSRAIDLTPLGPYAAKYLGYELQKGKLDLDLRYTVRSRQLSAQNVVRIDQFTLGQKTDSPDATSLPVKLGLAVLADPDGVMRLDVPASGSIDDPDFALGRLIWHAVVNVFTKIALSPFAALGHLFGGGTEKLDVLDFAPGLSTLGVDAERKLDVLARALRERPALRLEIEGSAEEASDGQAIRLQAAREAVRRAKWTELRRKQPALALEAVEVREDEYPRWLAAAVQALPKAPAAGADQKAPPSQEEMEARLLAASTVAPEAYRTLARDRAERARSRLLGAGGVDPGRLFLVEGGKRAADEKGARVYFTLK